MVLFHEIMQVLHLVDADGRTVCLMRARDGRFIGLFPVHGERCRHPVTAERWRQQVPRSRGISVLGEENGNGVPGRIQRPLPLPPLAFDPNVGLIHAPALPHEPLAAVARLFQWRAVSEDPPVDEGMLCLDPTFAQECFDVARAQRLGDHPSGRL
jgi:hypothetical protein